MKPDAVIEAGSRRRIHRVIINGYVYALVDDVVKLIKKHVRAGDTSLTATDLIETLEEVKEEF